MAENGNGKTLLGLPLTPDLVVKLIALVFALGMIWQRIQSMETSISRDLGANRDVIEERLKNIEWRLGRVEGRIDSLR